MFLDISENEASYNKIAFCILHLSIYSRILKAKEEYIWHVAKTRGKENAWEQVWEAQL